MLSWCQVRPYLNYPVVTATFWGEIEKHLFNGAWLLTGKIHFVKLLFLGNSYALLLQGYEPTQGLFFGLHITVFLGVYCLYSREAWENP